MHQTELYVKTTQCDRSDFVTIEPVEIRGRQFPMSRQEIIDSLTDKNLNTVRTMVDYKCRAWCLFSVVPDGLVIHRLTVKDSTHLKRVMNSLFETITYTPKKQGCHVSLDWPEYGTDDFLFKYLLSDGWQTCGLIRDRYSGYGSLWDGIKLEKQF